MLIAGDIGGTTTRLALVSPDAGPRKFLAEQEFRRGSEPAVFGLQRRAEAACL
jgi:glucokinase